MEEEIQLILSDETAKKIYREGIKSEEVLTEVKIALKDPKALLAHLLALPEPERAAYTSINLLVSEAAWWLQSLETEDLRAVDPVLAAILNKKFAGALGDFVEPDSRWTLSE